jgi:hypothetical protein
MKKRFIALFLSISLITGTLVSCKNNNGDKSDKESTQSPVETDNLSVADVVVIEGCEFEYTITEDRDTEFDAEVKIINKTNTAADGWKLSFNGDFTITETRNAKLVSSGKPNHEVVNEFWTRAINPYSSAIFTFTAEKEAETTPALDNFVLSEYKSDNPTEPKKELKAVTLKGYSEQSDGSSLEYNVLLWDIEHVSESYAIYRSTNGEGIDKIATIEDQNYFLDYDVEKGITYMYFVRQSYGKKTVESDTISIETTFDKSKGTSANEHDDNLSNDRSDLRIGYQAGDNSNHVSKDLTLDSKGKKGSSITWLSDFEQIISSQGKITRPTGKPFPVTMIAVLQSGGDFAQMKNNELQVAPLNNAVRKDMTMEMLEELNKDSKMPEITYNDDGSVRRINDIEEFETPINNISLFPVFSAEEARILLDSYLSVFELNEDIDIQFEECIETPTSNIFRFRQYYNGISVNGNGISMMTVSARRETGHVVSIVNGYLPNLNIETTPKVSLEEAKQIIMSEYNVDICEQEEPKLFIYYDINSPDVAPELTRKIYLVAGNDQNIWYVRMSAITGEILFAHADPVNNGGE